MLLFAVLAAPAWAQGPQIFPLSSQAPRTCNASAMGHGYVDREDGTPYVCDGTAWVDISDTGTVTTADVEAALPVSDATVLLKGSSDSTKRLRFEVDGITAGQTRIVTAPDANTTLPIFSHPMTFTGPTAARTVTLPDADFTVPGIASTNAFTGPNSFVDGNFSIVGSIDATKRARLEVDGFNTGGTRVFTLPGTSGDDTLATLANSNAFTGRSTFGSALDAASVVDLNETAGCITFEGSIADGAEARLCATNPTVGDSVFNLPNLATATTVTLAHVGSTPQTFGGVVTFGNNVSLSLLDVGSSSIGRIESNTASTPDRFQIEPGSTSNSIGILEVTDRTSDFNNGSCGTAACAHPQLQIHSATANTTEYNSQAYWGNAGRAIKTLSEASATSGFQFSIPSGGATGGTVAFTVFAADATDQQALIGTLQFGGVNKAGTETCPTPTVVGTPLNPVSVGTLTCTYAADTTPTNGCNVQWNCTSSLTQTALDLYYRVNLVGPGQVTPQ